MINPTRCLIDNWSIDQAVGLLYEDPHSLVKGGYNILAHFGGLSNLISALILYEQPVFLKNGSEITWQDNNEAAGILLKYINPVAQPYVLEEYQSAFYSSDYGASYYMGISKHLNAELFISTERANKITQMGVKKNEAELLSLLKKIDIQIDKELENIWIENVRCGIQSNFLLPSLTHYVLSQSSSKDDLLEVILQIRRSNDVIKLKNKIAELYANSKNYMKFQEELDTLLKKQFNKEKKNNNSISLGIKVLFLSISKTVNIDFIKHKTYLTYLRDIMACRTETLGLKNHIERIFKIGWDKIEPNHFPERS